MSQSLSSLSGSNRGLGTSALLLLLGGLVYGGGTDSEYLQAVIVARLCGITAFKNSLCLLCWLSLFLFWFWECVYTLWFFLASLWAQKLGSEEATHEKNMVPNWVSFIPQGLQSVLREIWETITHQEDETFNARCICPFVLNCNICHLIFLLFKLLISHQLEKMLLQWPQK